MVAALLYSFDMVAGTIFGSIIMVAGTIVFNIIMMNWVIDLIRILTGALGDAQDRELI
jgi:hypothetical protein